MIVNFSVERLPRDEKREEKKTQNIYLQIIQYTFLSWLNVSKKMWYLSRCLSGHHVFMF